MVLTDRKPEGRVRTRGRLLLMSIGSGVLLGGVVALGVVAMRKTSGTVNECIAPRGGAPTL